MTIAELRAIDAPTMNIVDAARALGMNKNTAYELIKADRFPVPTILIGAKRRVPTQKLRDVLGVV